MRVIQHLGAQGYASLVELGRALFPGEFVGDDPSGRQTVLAHLQAQCAFLVQSGVLATAYSPVDGDLVYCIREVFQGEERSPAPAPEAVATPARDAQPAVFRRRGDAEWQGGAEPPVLIEPAGSGELSPDSRTANYAVFFKLGTKLRPSCDSALRDLARVAAHASQIRVVGLQSRTSTGAEIPGLLASQRAAAVVNRLVDFGIDRFRIEMTVRPWDEQALSKDVFAVDPPTSLAAQARRVDISLVRD